MKPLRKGYRKINMLPTQIKTKAGKEFFNEFLSDTNSSYRAHILKTIIKIENQMIDHMVKQIRDEVWAKKDLPDFDLGVNEGLVIATEIIMGGIIGEDNNKNVHHVVYPEGYYVGDKLDPNQGGLFPRGNKDE